MIYALIFSAGAFAGSLLQHIAYRVGLRVARRGGPVSLSEGQRLEAVRRGLVADRPDDAAIEESRR